MRKISQAASQKAQISQSSGCFIAKQKTCLWTIQDLCNEVGLHWDFMRLKALWNAHTYPGMKSQTCKAKFPVDISFTAAFCACQIHHVPVKLLLPGNILVGLRHILPARCNFSSSCWSFIFVCDWVVTQVYLWHISNENKLITTLCP